MNEADLIKQLIEKGRATATCWIHEAVEGAKNSEDMNRYLLSIEAASVHFLAMIMMNRMIELKVTPEIVMKDIIRKVKAELIWVLAQSEKNKYALHVPGAKKTAPSLEVIN
jgi:hypothetical protein